MVKKVVKKTKKEKACTECGDSDCKPHEMNEKIMDQFSDSISEAIDKVYKKNPDFDSGAELLVVLNIFVAQVAADLNAEKKGLLNMIGDMYDDFIKEHVQEDTQKNTQRKQKEKPDRKLN